VNVNTHLSLVQRLRTSGVVTALMCRGRPLPYFSCQNSTTGDASKPVIDLWRRVQFPMNISP